MHVTRLVIEEGENTFSLRLHPRLTVVAGVDERARAGLVQELIGALGSTRRGINLEVCDDRGRRLGVLRPKTGGHRVVDLGESVDVSDEFRGPDGRVDLLGRYGIEARKANELLHLDRRRIDTNVRVDDDVARLAELDQTELWSAAARVRITDDELRNMVEESPVLDASNPFEELEERRQMAEQAQLLHERLIRESKRVAAVALVAAVPVTAMDPTMTPTILMIALISTLLSMLFRQRLAAAERQEQEALRDAGVDSYLGFVVNRVNELMDDTEARRRRIAVAEDHRSAAVAWTQIAGDVSVDWALENHEAIETASRLRKELAALGQISSTAPTLDDATTAIAQAVITHVGRLRNIGTGGESFPLILDDPFTEAAPAAKLTLVELLARTAGSPQIILLTDQDEVASWARLEALTGEVALVEPVLEKTKRPGKAGVDRGSALQDLAPPAEPDDASGPVVQAEVDDETTAPDQVTTGQATADHAPADHGVVDHPVPERVGRANRKARRSAPAPTAEAVEAQPSAPLGPTDSADQTDSGDPSPAAEEPVAPPQVDGRPPRLPQPTAHLAV